MKNTQPDPPKRWDSKDILQRTNLVRTQSGQIVPPRLKKSESQQKVNITSEKNNKRINESPKEVAGSRIPPTPPKRKNYLRKQVSGQVFMNLVEINGHCGMHVNTTQQEKNSKDQKQNEWDAKQALITNSYQNEMWTMHSV